MPPIVSLPTPYYWSGFHLTSLTHFDCRDISIYGEGTHVTLSQPTPCYWAGFHLTIWRPLTTYVQFFEIDQICKGKPYNWRDFDNNVEQCFDDNVKDFDENVKDIGDNDNDDNDNDDKDNDDNDNDDNYNDGKDNDDKDNYDNDNDGKDNDDKGGWRFPAFDGEGWEGDKLKTFMVRMTMAMTLK